MLFCGNEFMGNAFLKSCLVRQTGTDKWTQNILKPFVHEITSKQKVIHLN